MPRRPLVLCRYGPVPLGLVKARAFVRIWPPTEVCLIRSHYNPADWPSEHDEVDAHGAPAIGLPLPACFEDVPDVEPRVV